MTNNNNINKEVIVEVTEVEAAPVMDAPASEETPVVEAPAMDVPKKKRTWLRVVIAVVVGLVVVTGALVFGFAKYAEGQRETYTQNLKDLENNSTELQDNLDSNMAALEDFKADMKDLSMSLWPVAETEGVAILEDISKLSEDVIFLYEEVIANCTELQKWTFDEAEDAKYQEAIDAAEKLVVMYEEMYAEAQKGLDYFATNAYEPLN